ncbi:MAG: hypothetical protein NZ518_04020, partial [Dehalococcoidia bacterium]|nr:hypothetical protein [Dehalococcoidia bacterium]
MATPPFGVNIAIGRRLNLRPLDANFRRFDEDGRRSRNVLRTTIERLKYVGRPPLPDVREALHELRE